jgi:dTDP-4-dehydrorhamnose reductase
MRVLVTGGHGQLASDLVQALEPHSVVAPGRESLDITDPSSVRLALEDHSPDVVINTAAFHNVDACEDEPELSFLTNAIAPRNLAESCKNMGMFFVHISTDYVFSGRQTTPYGEDDPIGPINLYGISKAAGEMAVRYATKDHLIVRTTGLYGQAGQATRHGNFVERMLLLREAGKPISVVSDQVLTPSATVDVARTIVQLIAARAVGTFHVTNSGQCSWYEFASAIFRLAKQPADVKPVLQADWPVRAARPSYSVLAADGLRRVGIAEPRPWQDALAEYLQRRGRD